MSRLFLSVLFLTLFSSSEVQAANLPSAKNKTVAPVYNLEIKVADSSYSLSQKELETWRILKTELRFSPGYQSEIENGNLCQYFSSLDCRLSFSLSDSNHIKNISSHEINVEMIQKFIDDLARKVNKDPENAKFAMENGRAIAFSLSKKGVELDKESSLTKLVEFVKGRNFQIDQDLILELPYTEKFPEVTIDSIENMGIDSLIGQGKSNFRGSPKNRIHNIKVATSRFNGLMIKPGEEFSFVKNLGEVDGEHGYLPELVIKNDKTEPEFGGGICQVSTTAFRAAINSGLEITARRNHAYPVAYYNPQGMDASVYVPRPDLRFKNDSPGYILVQTEIQGTELTFSFFGKDDGRKTEVIGPKIIERNPDGSMKTTFTQKVLDKNGSVIREDVFNSNYDSPDKYPHPGESSGVLTTKPDNWSDKEWSKYKKEHGV
ncbi:MAG: VanW family protein [Patescibacteria group bacterium]